MCDARALAIAAKLDTLGPMNAMQANHLRALYHAQRGELTEAAHYEQRVELDAIQRGTAWQAELLAPRHQMRLARWTQDLVTNKRAARTLATLMQEIPSFAATERRARAADLVLRRRYQEALPLLEVDEPPPANGAFIFMRWLLAIAYNGLGADDQTVAVAHDALPESLDLATFRRRAVPHDRSVRRRRPPRAPDAALVLGSAAGELAAPHTPALRLIGERVTRSWSADAH